MISPKLNAAHAELAQRLSDYRLDADDAPFPLSKRLARENGWTAGYTQRVIEEYKRFAYMAVAAGRHVSPSEDVDEVWHTHLLYTAEYWKVFCGEVLQTPLHHTPSKGGLDERAKYDKMYAETLETYERLFGEAPPSDIWPPQPGQKKPEIHPSTHWIIRKPKLKSFGFLLGLLVVGGIAAGCAETGLNVFDWTGPEFLRFYMVMWIAGLIAAFGVRFALSLPASGPPDAYKQLGPYDIAFLRGGRVAAVNAAMASLVAQGMLTIDRRRQVYRIPPNQPFQDPFEEAVFLQCGSVLKSTLVQDARVAMALAEIEYRLRSRGLYVPQTLVNQTRAWPVLIALIPPAIGTIKIFIGVSRDRPVGFLVMLCIASVIAAICFVAKPRRSRYGNKVLAAVRQRFSHLQSVGHLHHAQVPTEDIAMGVAVFGAVCLAGSPILANYRPLPTTDNSSGGGSGGGSSCSSGGSCGGGGGGCGGGGCGGCGGG